MSLVIASLAKAFAQLSDPAILRVLAKSLVITLFIFVALGTGLWFGLSAALDSIVRGMTDDIYGETIVTVVTVLTILLAGWLMFRVIALAVIQFFADEIVRAVERRHYPEASNQARDLPFREDAANSLRGVGRAIGFNLLALPAAVILLFTAIGPAVVFLIVNAVLLGRELTDMAWLRHREPDDLKSPVGAFQRFALGGAIAGLMLIPFANLLAPILGAAAGTHLTHQTRTKAQNGSKTANA